MVWFWEIIKLAVWLNVEPLGGWADSLCLKWSKWPILHENVRIPITTWYAREGNGTRSMSAKCNGSWTHHAVGKHTGAFAGAARQSRCIEQRLSYTEETRMGVHGTMHVCWVEIMILSKFRKTWHKQARGANRPQTSAWMCRTLWNVCCDDGLKTRQ